MKYKYKKNALIVCLLWFASLFTAGNFAYAQTESFVPAPVEILLAEPELANSSISASLFNQAKKYHDGDGVPQDFLRAHDLYLKAANMGNNGARINLGYLYFMGEGVAQNYMKAHNWYISAANNGSKFAQLNLAMMYQNGFGVAKNNNKAAYWRTYDQVHAVHEKRAIAVDAAKKSLETKPVSIQKIVSKPVTRAAIPMISKELLPIAERVIEKTAAIEDIQIVANTEPTLIVSDLAFTTIVPKAQQPTQQAFVGNTLKSEESPKTDLSLPRLIEADPYIPQWVSTAMSVVMLAMVITTSVWFCYQYTKIGKQKKARVFAKAFYGHHRDQLRINYLRYPLKHRRIDTMNDTWAVALCVLMVRFAQNQQDEDTLVGIQSKNIIQALKDSPFKAKQAVFPLVMVTQQKIFDDIQAHEYHFKETANVSAAPLRATSKQLAPVIKIKDVLTMESAKETPFIITPKDVLKRNYAPLVKRNFIGTDTQKAYS